MQNDINTKGCTQWFYFSIENKKKIKIRLNILNFVKNSIYYLV
jgi:glutamate formiminotransferase